MYNFKKSYEEACDRSSDINEHLPVLDRLAKECKHVTEFGVREGASTRAWMNNDVELISYDLFRSEEVMQLFYHAREAGKSAQYIIANILQLQAIAETDLLFIDSLHNYEQCHFELTNFGNRARKYIVFHDTETFGKVGESSPSGLLLAISEFLLNNRE